MEGLFRGMALVGLMLIALNALADYDLFKVSIPLEELQEGETKQHQYDVALAKAIRTELIRLTGQLDINEQEDVKAILDKPRSWLTSYRYLPIKQEGVVVGTQLEFVFDKERLYQFFQQQNLIVWPMNSRPQTVVMGTQLLAGTETKLDQQGLMYAPRLDYQAAADRLGVPVTVPDNQDLWVKAQTPENDKKVAYVIDTFQVDYLLVFEVVRYNSEQNQFFWKLYDKNGNLVKEGQATDRSSLLNLNNVFASLLNYFSQPYRDQAGFLGEVTLTVANVNTVEKLTALEQHLNLLKPVVHQSRLLSIKNYQAKFEVVYQGKYPQFLKRLEAIPHLQLISDDAITSMIDGELVEQASEVELEQPDPQTTDQLEVLNTQEGIEG